ncbi:MAG: APC family permease [Rhodothalassiaceae bacterium]
MKGATAQRQQEQGLERTLSLPLLSVYGLGTILGAGIYVVIGDVIGRGGVYAPLAFLFAALVAGLTAIGYGELAGRIPRSGGPAAYLQQAFGICWLSGLVGWMIAATGVVSAATIVTGFTSYLSVLVDWPDWPVMITVVLVLGGIAAAGIEESAWTMGVTTAAGVAGLIYVLVLGAPNVGDLPGKLSDAGGVMDGAVLAGLLGAAFTAFYAFIGFEDMVHTAEEAKNARKIMPTAIIIALGVSLVFYLAVSVVAVASMSPQAMREAKAPLVALIDKEGGSRLLLGVLSLMIIVNSALAQIIMASRVIHGLGKRHGAAPEILARINPRTNSPLLATALSAAVVLALALFFPTETLARGTSFIILLVFIASNAALIRLKARHVGREDGLTVPIWVPWLGIVLTAGLIIAQPFLGGGGH